MNYQPSAAFIAASWLAVGVGILSYNVGLWNADMMLSEKGYYFTVLMYGLFSAISIQKAVRDRLENIPVTDLYYAISWFSMLLSILLLIIGLWNASMLLSEKGFYAMSFFLSIFAAIVVQKNTRDNQAHHHPTQYDNSYSTLKANTRFVDERGEENLSFAEGTD